MQFGAIGIRVGHEGMKPDKKAPQTSLEAPSAEVDTVVKQFHARRATAAKANTHLTHEQVAAVEAFHANRQKSIDAFNHS